MNFLEFVHEMDRIGLDKQRKREILNACESMVRIVDLLSRGETCDKVQIESIFEKMKENGMSFKTATKAELKRGEGGRMPGCRAEGRGSKYA